MGALSTQWMLVTQCLAGVTGSTSLPLPQGTKQRPNQLRLSSRLVPTTTHITSYIHLLCTDVVISLVLVAVAIVCSLVKSESRLLGVQWLWQTVVVLHAPCTILVLALLCRAAYSHRQAAQRTSVHLMAVELPLVSLYCMLCMLRAVCMCHVSVCFFVQLHPWTLIMVTTVALLAIAIHKAASIYQLASQQHAKPAIYALNLADVDAKSPTSAIRMCPAPATNACACTAQTDSKTQASDTDGVPQQLYMSSAWSPLPPLAIYMQETCLNNTCSCELVSPETISATQQTTTQTRTESSTQQDNTQTKAKPFHTYTINASLSDTDP